MNPGGAHVIKRAYGWSFSGSVIWTELFSRVIFRGKSCILCLHVVTQTERARKAGLGQREGSMWLRIPPPRLHAGAYNCL